MDLAVLVGVHRLHARSGSTKARTQDVHLMDFSDMQTAGASVHTLAVHRQSAKRPSQMTQAVHVIPEDRDINKFT